ncbi:MAG: cell division protein FtsB [Pseudomonadota bacterium]
MKRGLLIAVLVCGIVVLQFQLWFGEGSLLQLWQLKRDVASQRAENEELRERNRALRAEVLDLKSGLDAVEERARNDLGMIAEDEVFYQVIGSTSDRKQGEEGE